MTTFDLDDVENSSSTEATRVARLLSWKDRLNETRTERHIGHLNQLLGFLAQLQSGATHLFFSKFAERVTGGAVDDRMPRLSNSELAELRDIARHNFDLVAGGVVFECRVLVRDFELIAPTEVLTAMIYYACGGVATSSLASNVYELGGRAERASVRAVDMADNAVLAFEAVMERRTREFDETIKEGQEQLIAFKQSLSEEVKVRAASQLWNDRATSHRWSMIVCFILFATIVTATITTLVVWFREVISILPRDNNNHIEYAGLALVVIPAIGIGWLLRIFARFVQSNNVLADDARQRQAMIRTYLSLVGEKDSGVTDKDRLIMLNAIFRPLPGGQSEEVAPPTVLDLLKKDT
jgi:hypothetical protein